MLRDVTGVTLGRQWRRIQAKLPQDWFHARLALTISNPRQTERASALLSPLTPGRAGDVVRFEVLRRGHAQSPVAIDRALSRLDAERIRGTLALVGAQAAAPAGYERATAPVEEIPLAEAWDALVADLPEGWSDVYAEVALTSSDDLDPAALALAPINPSRYGSALAFRFRCARSFGYGAAAGMVRRCFARLDEAGIDGTLNVLRVLSDTKPVGTQGPVWYVEGKAV
jgi:hypothetical protein